mmetsp:Transcript_61689/g.174229  ORF Transcript_61689/g.174229 Transcript_61689/m.174229 type:complete len:308 (+) Transcript_61689:124-1047(+)
MSFALRPIEGAARLLGSTPERRARAGQFAFSESSETVQGAIKAIQQHVAYIRKDTWMLRTARSRSTSVEQVKQVYGVARDTAAEARRILHELDVSAGSSSGALAGGRGGRGGAAEDEQRLQRLTHQKLAESMERASSELDQSWKDFVAADAGWADRQKAMAAAETAEAAAASATAAAEMERKEVGADSADLERGTRQLVQEQELVAQAEIEIHAVIADEYYRDVARVAQNVQGLQRAMVDLALHAATQGETLEGIEASMGQSWERTTQALEQIQETDHRQKKTMKFTACLGLLVCVISVIIVSTVWR